MRHKMPRTPHPNRDLASPLSPRRRKSIWARLTRSLHGSSMDWDRAPPLTAGLREGFGEVLRRGISGQEEEGRGGREDRSTYVPPTVEEEEEEERGRGRGRERERRGGVDESLAKGSAPRPNERPRFPYGSSTAQVPPPPSVLSEGEVERQGNRRGEQSLARPGSAVSNSKREMDGEIRMGGGGSASASLAVGPGAGHTVSAVRGGASLAAGSGPSVGTVRTAGPRPSLSPFRGTQPRGSTVHHGSALAPVTAPAPNLAPAPATAPASAPVRTPTNTQAQPVYPDYFSPRTQSLRRRPAQLLREDKDELFIGESAGSRSADHGSSCLGGEGEVDSVVGLRGDRSRCDYSCIRTWAEEVSSSNNPAPAPGPGLSRDRPGEGSHVSAEPQPQPQPECPGLCQPEPQPSQLPGSQGYAAPQVSHSDQHLLPHMYQPQLSQPQLSQPQLSQPQLYQPQLSQPQLSELSHHRPRILRSRDGDVVELGNGLVIPLPPCPFPHSHQEPHPHPPSNVSPSPSRPPTRYPSPAPPAPSLVDHPPYRYNSPRPATATSSTYSGSGPPTPIHPSSTQRSRSHSHSHSHSRPRSRYYSRSRSNSPCPSAHLQGLRYSLPGRGTETGRQRSNRWNRTKSKLEFLTAVAVRVTLRVCRRAGREFGSYLRKMGEAREESARGAVDVEQRVRKWVRREWEGYRVRRQWV